MGRHKKYETAAALGRAVARYFKSITYEKPVIIYREDIVEDPKTGQDVVKKVPEFLTDKDGETVMETVWRKEPSIADLRLFIGVSKSTWAEYAKDENKAVVIEDARDRMEARLTELLNTRNSTQGVKFNLEANYGWKSKMEIEHTGESVERYLERLTKDGERQGF